ncbi:UNVERIFIED_CONTAM: hypothetical protein Sradi_6971700 [Sesamum radiatum]|uniref:Reverse transcriptase zinc-binding domain-containing protein n=1 Tax=Sesamum radiatum TaxID=300843 RepID=A0AAW2JGY5_SESRA
MDFRGWAVHNSGCTCVATTPSTQVPWRWLLGGKFKIPRHDFILWLALLERLSTLDRLWMMEQDSGCVLCGRLHMESHDHLFFKCPFSSHCISLLKAAVRFQWLDVRWARATTWASKRWRGSHLLNAAARTLLASLVYHIWSERNRRRFSSTASSAPIVARKAIEDVKLRILSTSVPPSLQRSVLYRIWKLPSDRN